MPWDSVLIELSVGFSARAEGLRLLGAVVGKTGPWCASVAHADVGRNPDAAFCASGVFSRKTNPSSGSGAMEMLGSTSRGRLLDIGLASSADGMGLGVALR